MGPRRKPRTPTRRPSSPDRAPAPPATSPRRQPRTPTRRPSSPAPGPSRPSRSTSRVGSAGLHRRRRYLWLKEIQKLQKSTDLLLRKKPFSLVVREICGKFSRGVDLFWQAQALLALQEAAEAF